MTSIGYRLGDHVVAEPLVGDFAAWWCNLAPLTGAMHTVRYLLPTLQAYLEDPEASFEGANEPSLAGGPFVAVAPERSSYVAHLERELTSEYADGAALTEATLSFSEELLAAAKGQSLEEFYARCPPPLRGLVELVYDYHNRPAIRFEEGLLYRSTHHKPHLHGLRLFELASDAQRHFYVTTPHEAALDGTRLGVPLDSERVRALMNLDLIPQPMTRVADLLGAEPSSNTFSEGPPRHSPIWTSEQTRVRYFGHATVLIEHGGVSFLVDPVIPVAPKDGQARLSFDDLPPHIDFVAITHIHSDHFLPETLVRLAPRIGKLLLPRNVGVAFGDVSMRRIVERLGITSGVEVDTFDAFRQGDMEVVVAPFYGEHGDLLHGSKATFLVRAGQRTFYFAADSSCLDAKVPQELVKVFGSLQDVYMNTETEGAPISWPFDGLFPRKRNRALEMTRRCRGSNFEEGMALLQAIKPRRLFSYAMGLEPWLSYIIGPPDGPESSRMRAVTKLLAGARDLGIQSAALSGPQEVA